MSDEMRELKSALAALLEATVSPGQGGDMEVVADLIESMIAFAIRDAQEPKL